MTFLKIRNSNNYDLLNDTKTTQSKKPIFIALAIVGILGLALLAVGLAAFGGDKYAWVVGSLSRIGKVQAVIMMSAGATVAASVISIITIASYWLKNKPSKRDSNLIEEPGFQSDPDIGSMLSPPGFVAPEEVSDGDIEAGATETTILETDPDIGSMLSPPGFVATQEVLDGYIEPGATKTTILETDPDIGSMLSPSEFVEPEEVSDSDIESSDTEKIVIDIECLDRSKLKAKFQQELAFINALTVNFSQNLPESSKKNLLEYFELSSSINSYATGFKPDSENKKERAQKMLDGYQKMTREQRNHMLKLIFTSRISYYEDWSRILYTILFSDLIDLTWEERPTTAKVWDLAMLYSVYQNRMMLEMDCYEIDWHGLAIKALEDVKPEERVLYFSLIRDAFPNQFEFLFGKLLLEESQKSPNALAQALFYKILDPTEIKDLICIQENFSKDPKIAKKWLKYLQNKYLETEDKDISAAIKSFVLQCYEANTFEEVLMVIQPDTMKIMLLDNQSPFPEMCKSIYTYWHSKVEMLTNEELDRLKFFVDLCAELKNPLLEQVEKDFTCGFNHWFHDRLENMYMNLSKKHQKLKAIKLAIYKKGYSNLSAKEKKTNNYLNKIIDKALKNIPLHLPHFYHGTTSFLNVDSILSGDCIDFQLGTLGGSAAGAWFSEKRLEGMGSYSSGARTYHYCFAVSETIQDSAEKTPRKAGSDDNKWTGFQDEEGIKLGLQEGNLANLCHLSVPENEVKSMKWAMRRAHYQNDQQQPITVLPHSITDCLTDWLKNPQSIVAN